MFGGCLGASWKLQLGLRTPWPSSRLLGEGDAHLPDTPPDCRQGPLSGCCLEQQAGRRMEPSGGSPEDVARGETWPTGARPARSGAAGGSGGPGPVPRGLRFHCDLFERQWDRAVLSACSPPDTAQPGASWEPAPGTWALTPAGQECISRQRAWRCGAGTCIQALTRRMRAPHAAAWLLQETQRVPTGCCSEERQGCQALCSWRWQWQHRPFGTGLPVSAGCQALAERGQCLQGEWCRLDSGRAGHLAPQPCV